MRIFWGQPLNSDQQGPYDIQQLEEEHEFVSCFNRGFQMHITHSDNYLYPTLHTNS